MIGRNIFFKGWLTVILVFVLPSCGFAQMQPGEVVVQTIDKSLKVLQSPSLQGPDKIEERRTQLWLVLEPIFHFEAIAKRALGHHWKARTPEERKEFTELFIKVLKDVYLGKSDSYAGEKIVYLRETLAGKRSRIQTEFYTITGKKASVDFNMHNVDGTWKIYDVIIEGVSMVSNYRSQFNSLLTKSPFEDLLKQLRAKAFVDHTGA